MNDLPTERLRWVGESALSNTELLSIVMGTDKGADALKIDQLPRVSVNEMTVRYGITPARACRLKAAIELGRRAHAPSDLETATIRSPQDAASIFLPNMSHLEQETLWTILLNARNAVIGLVKVYQGQLNRVDIRIADVFREAVRQNACSIVLGHNHPSGDPTPSPEDVQITKMAADIGETLGITVIDHIVVAGGRWISLRERGLGFSK